MIELRHFPIRVRTASMLCGILVILAACQPADDGPPADDNVSNETSLNLPSVVPQPPMDRAGLLAVVAEAASATAAGSDDLARQRELDGSRFEVRIRFGCRGPAPELRDAVLGWSFDSEDRTLRVRAMPTIDANNEIVGEIIGRNDSEAIEAVEGFWIPRPWLLEPVCPTAAAVSGVPAEPAPAPAAGTAPPIGPRATPTATPTAPAARAPAQPGGGQAPVEDPQEMQAPPPATPKIGIAHFFRETESRTRQRGMRPYETVTTLGPNQSPGSQGFNLVLSGRLRALPGGRVVACVSRGAEAPPECVVSVDFDRVWIEQAGNRTPLAEWRSS